MDHKYICNHLMKLSELFYGKKKCYAKHKGGMYIFGNKKTKNIISRQAAIYLCIGQEPKKKKKSITRKRTK